MGKPSLVLDIITWKHLTSSRLSILILFTSFYILLFQSWCSWRQVPWQEKMSKSHFSSVQERFSPKSKQVKNNLFQSVSLSLSLIFAAIPKVFCDKFIPVDVTTDVHVMLVIEWQWTAQPCVAHRDWDWLHDGVIWCWHFCAIWICPPTCGVTCLFHFCMVSSFISVVAYIASRCILSRSHGSLHNWVTSPQSGQLYSWEEKTLCSTHRVSHPSCPCDGWLNRGWHILLRHSHKGYFFFSVQACVSVFVTMKRKCKTLFFCVCVCVHVLATILPCPWDRKQVQVT